MLILSSCNSDLANCCKDGALVPILKILSNIIHIIQIVAPIILLVMATIQLTNLVMNPELKGGLKNLYNKFIAAIVIFFIPLFADVALSTIGSNNSFQISSCLKEVNSSSYSYSTPQFISIEDKNKLEDIIKRVNVKGNNINNSGGAHITGKGIGAEVAKYAQSWVGKVGYHFASNEPLSNGSYSDCSHFVYHCLNDFGLMDNYVRSVEWEAGHVKGAVRVNSLAEAVPGDVLCWDFGDGTGHVEIYIGNGRSVGCCGSGNSGSTVEHDAGGYTSIWHITAYD